MEKLENLDKKFLKVTVILALVFCSACSRDWNEWSRAEKGAAIGGTGGALVGGAVGSQMGAGGAGAVIGGVTGAGAGALVGNEQDKDRERRRRY